MKFLWWSSLITPNRSKVEQSVAQLVSSAHRCAFQLVEHLLHSSRKCWKSEFYACRNMRMSCLQLDQKHLQVTQKLNAHYMSAQHLLLPSLPASFTNWVTNSLSPLAIITQLTLSMQSGFAKRLRMSWIKQLIIQIHEDRYSLSFLVCRFNRVKATWSLKLYLWLPDNICQELDIKYY